LLYLELFAYGERNRKHGFWYNKGHLWLDKGFWLAKPKNVDAIQPYRLVKELIKIEFVCILVMVSMVSLLDDLQLVHLIYVKNVLLGIIKHLNSCIILLTTFIRYNNLIQSNAKWL